MRENSMHKPRNIMLSLGLTFLTLYSTLSAQIVQKQKANINSSNDVQIPILISKNYANELSKVLKITVDELKNNEVNDGFLYVTLTKKQLESVKGVTNALKILKYAVLDSISGWQTTNMNKMVTGPNPYFNAPTYTGDENKWETLTIYFEGKNIGDASSAGGYMSLSLPEFNDFNDYGTVLFDGMDNLTKYVKGSSIYTCSGNSITSSYVLLDGFEQTWGGNESHKMWVKVTPYQAGKLNIYTKMSIGNIRYPAGSCNSFDQQGWPVKYYSISIPSKAKPDLIVSDIKISPTSPVAGESVTITATLKNQGNADAARFYLKYYIDDVYQGEDDLTFGLGQGNSNDESLSVIVSSSGQHTVKVVVDPDNNIDESVESNNSRQEAFSWSPPPPIKSIVSLKWINSSGQEISISNDEEYVYLKITTSGYTNGEQISAEIYEADVPPIDPDDFVIAKTITINNNSGQTSWLAVWQNDGSLGGLPEYYFKVGSQKSVLLEVKNGGPFLGSGIALDGQNKTFNIYKYDGLYRLIDATKAMYTGDLSLNEPQGVIATYNAEINNNDSPTKGNMVVNENPDKIFIEPAAISAHKFMSMAYDYFKNYPYNRNSWDNQGSTIKMVVHAIESRINAAWNGNYVWFGDGDGIEYSNFAGAYDIIVHELTHAVTNTTAKLIYQNESGALSESYSDVFASIADGNWEYGENVIPSPHYQRNLSNPHLGYPLRDYPSGRFAQPAHINEFIPENSSFLDQFPDRDKGGVHFNSGIPNKAAYLIASIIGRDKTARIYYQTLTTKLMANAQFIDAANLSLESAKELYGLNSAEYNAVKSGFQQVGILSPDNPPNDVVTISTGPSGSPNPVSSNSSVNCTVTATDSRGDNISYKWLSSNIGTFNNSNIQNPIWLAPSNGTNQEQNYTISVTATCSNGKTATSSYQQRVTGIPPTSSSIKPVPPTSVSSGTEFWVEIKVGDPNVVTDLFGINFSLNYNTTYLEYISAESVSWFGTDLVWYSSNDETNGKTNISISRKNPLSGINGSGFIARIKYQLNTVVPNNTTLNFILTNITANDHNSASIILNPINAMSNVATGIIVWPGDTNNDGKVDQADILPLGFYWNKTGVMRQNTSTQWLAQFSTPWNPQAATYADANGSGKVDQGDVLPIGQNWGKTHSINKISLDQGVEIKNGSRIYFEQGEVVAEKNEYIVYMKYDQNDGLLSALRGISFLLKYDASIEKLIIERGNYFGEEVVDYANYDEMSREVGYGLTSIETNNRINNQGIVVKLKVKAKESDGEIKIVNIEGVDVLGNKVMIESSDMRINIAGLKNEEFPSDYKLEQNYPNPFNPSTSIEYSLETAGYIRLSVYNALGQEMIVLREGYISAGRYKTIFNGKDYPSGNYFYKLKTKADLIIRKMTLLK